MVTCNAGRAWVIQLNAHMTCQEVGPQNFQFEYIMTFVSGLTHVDLNSARIDYVKVPLTHVHQLICAFFCTFMYRFQKHEMYAM